MVGTSIGRIAVAGALLAGLAMPAAADVAATGTFGIDIHVSFPFASGTFDGAITGFDAGPFDVGGTPVDLATDVGTMSIPTGNLTNIDIGALAVTFDFMAVDDDLTANDFGFSGAGVAVCDDAITCAQGQGSFVSDLSAIVDPSDVLPDGFAYTFDGTVFVDPGPFDAAGVFGVNGFAPAAVPAGSAVAATSDPTTFFDSRQNTLRDFLVDLTFAEVTAPGTVSFLGKSALPGALPANVVVNPEVSIFVDIVTGGGLAYTPPVDVCVHYDDADMDGIVDGTSVEVDTLVLLHALAVGDDFQDVTTFVGGGLVCGQVGSLSPFVVAVGPGPTTTTTTTTLPGTTTTTTIGGSTTSTVTTTTTTTTTLPVLVCDTAVDCLDAAQLVELCPGETIPKKLSKIYAKKLAKARRLLDKIGRTDKVKKGERLLAKATKNVAKVGAKAAKLAAKAKNPLSPTCLAYVETLLEPIADALASRNLGVPFPTGTGSGACGKARSMAAHVGPVTFDGTKGDGFVFHENFGGAVLVQGCQDSSGPNDECEKVLTVSVPYAGGGPTTYACVFGAILTFSDTSDPSSGIYQDLAYYGSACSVTVDGDPDGLLTGSFSGTLQPGDVPVTEGCFSSRPLS